MVATSAVHPVHPVHPVRPLQAGRGTRAVDRRTAAWVDLVGDLLARRLTAFPHRTVAEHLHAGFGGGHVAWSRSTPAGPTLDLLRPIAGWPPPDLLADTTLVHHHPLRRWTALTGRLQPMTIGRVPRGYVTAQGRWVVAEHLVPIGAEQELSVVYRYGEGGHAVFVLGRSGEDYSDEDLQVAAAVQPLLALVDRQVAVTGGLDATCDGAADLTGRELAVVRLLAQGRPAAAIAARLAISERTVHRHLQGAYRKLGARDRVTAVLAAHERGLL